MSDPKGVLRDYLDQGPRHVLGILEGLSDEDLRRPILPSGWGPACVSGSTAQTT
jgi:hypothetical protein